MNLPGRVETSWSRRRPGGHSGVGVAYVRNSYASRKKNAGAICTLLITEIKAVIRVFKRLNVLSTKETRQTVLSLA